MLLSALLACQQESTKCCCQEATWDETPPAPMPKFMGVLVPTDCKAFLHVLEHAKFCPIPGSAPGQAGCGSEELGPVENVPAHGRGLQLCGL